MLPPELMGGGASPPDMGGGLPPGLEGLLGGGAPAGPPPAPEGGSTTDLLEQMIELAKTYIDTDEDEEDKHTMAKVLTILQGYLAEEQKEGREALGGKLSPKIMARAYGGG